MAKYKMHILICGGTGCKSSNSLKIIDNFHKILAEKGLADDVQVIKTGCFGFCEKGPIVKIMPDNTFYTQVKPEDVERIVNEHIIKGRKVPELLYTNPENKEHVSDSKHMDFYRKQIRIALRNCGFVDPENIEESISRHQERSPRPWWRRLPHRCEVGSLRQEPGRPEVHHLQRR